VEILHLVPFVPTIRDRFRSAIALAGKNQGEIAEELDITAGYLSMVLKGQRTPSLRLAVRLSEVSGIDVADFCPAEPAATEESMGARA
jgi:transcriptional regulator with XRE-family HTH domain